MTNAVRAEAATKIYGSGPTEVRALDDVTVAFDKGRFSAIMGPSGSGKSTLLHCVAGLDDLTSGKVFIGDQDLGELNDKDLTLLRRTKVGFVFQAFNLVPTLSARENITLPLDIAGTKPDAQWFSRVVEVLELGDRLDHRPSELSGGQQQRVAVARALASRPEVIFADLLFRLGLDELKCQVADRRSNALHLACPVGEIRMVRFDNGNTDLRQSRSHGTSGSLDLGHALGVLGIACDGPENVEQWVAEHVHGGKGQHANCKQ